MSHSKATPLILAMNRAARSGAPSRLLPSDITRAGHYWLRLAGVAKPHHLSAWSWCPVTMGWIDLMGTKASSPGHMAGCGYACIAEFVLPDCA